MSKQVLDISQMQHLKELGVDTSKGMMYYWVIRNGEYSQSKGTYIFPKEPTSIKLELHPYDFMSDVAIGRVECIAAFTLEDILDLLPNKVDDELILFVEKGKHKWRIGYVDISSEEIFEDFSDKNFIDAAYNMLCWVIENGYLETK